MKRLLVILLIVLSALALGGCKAKMPGLDLGDAPNPEADAIVLEDGQPMYAMVCVPTPGFTQAPGWDAPAQARPPVYGDVVVVMEKSADGLFYRVQRIDKIIPEKGDVLAFLKRTFMPEKEGWIPQSQLLASTTSLKVAYDGVQVPACVLPGVHGVKPLTVYSDPEGKVPDAAKTLASAPLYVYNRVVSASGTYLLVGYDERWSPSAVDRIMIGWIQESECVEWDSSVALHIYDSGKTQVCEGRKCRHSQSHDASSSLYPVTGSTNKKIDVLWQNRGGAWTYGFGKTLEKSPRVPVRTGSVAVSKKLERRLLIERLRFDSLLGVMAGMYRVVSSQGTASLRQELESSLGVEEEQLAKVPLSVLIREKFRLVGENSAGPLNMTVDKLESELRNLKFKLKFSQYIALKYFQLRTLVEERTGVFKWDKGTREWRLTNERPQEWWWENPVGTRYAWLPLEYLP